MAAVALLVAAFGAALLALPAVDAFSEGKGLAFGTIVVAVIGASHVAARRSVTS